MIFCSQCKCSRLLPWGATRCCISPNAEERRHLVSGQWPDCSVMRGNQSLCGSAGKWFEPLESAKPKEPKKSVWKQLIEWVVNR